MKPISEKITVSSFTYPLTFCTVNISEGGLRLPPLVIMIINGGRRSPPSLKLTEQKANIFASF